MTVAPVYRCKVGAAGIEALANLLSHDPDLLVIGTEGDGLVSAADHAALVALLNNLQSPFRQEVGGNAVTGEAPLTPAEAARLGALAEAQVQSAPTQETREYWQRLADFYWGHA